MEKLLNPKLSGLHRPRQPTHVFLYLGRHPLVENLNSPPTTIPTNVSTNSVKPDKALTEDLSIHFLEFPGNTK